MKAPHFNGATHHILEFRFMQDIQIQTASPRDCAKVALLLKMNGLCISDIDSCLEGFVVVRNNGNLIGTGGLEFFGEAALLRSVAVETLYRGQKIGEKIYDELIKNAKEKGVKNMYLLTIDADGYFERFGFKTINRDAAPETIQTHAQFTELCPGSAIVMQKTL